jgi:lipid-binding SYLF domain-containing protein
MLKRASVFAAISGLAVLTACTTGGSMDSMAQPAAAQPLAVPPPATVQATSATSVLDADSRAAVFSLVSNYPKMDGLAHKAKGVLIFPSVVRAGFLAGASHGSGELIENGKVTGYYATTSLSYGFQAGVQQYAYAMLFMTDAALNSLKPSSNFEIGVGPTVVVIDEGAAKNLNTETATSDVYAMVFDQRGLMVGTALRGTKITRVSR